ncbi:MAG TPA: rhomboid family intramembrane serine protease [bacterium]|nr:rhomboid family intramembrane serine protease [bacterium]
MVIPIGDDNTDRRLVPIVTWSLIGVNFVVFFVELAYGDPFIERWSFMASRFLTHPGTEWITIFSSMFMHAGWLHILGNMLYLFIFGDNVEDAFGHWRFLVFYLTCGVAANFAQMGLDVTSTEVSLGASGAIAGILAAYLVMFPRAKVKVLMGYFVVPLPALIVIGGWIVMQIFSQVGSISDATGDGVAYMAHIGGFAAGLVWTAVWRSAQRRRLQA